VSDRARLLQIRLAEKSGKHCARHDGSKDIAAAMLAEVASFPRITAASSSAEESKGQTIAQPARAAMASSSSKAARIRNAPNASRMTLR
jgi:hypothetical protein